MPDGSEQDRRGPANREVVLASASPARKGLLLAAGVQPRILPSDVDEEVIAASPTAADLRIGELAQFLAESKCREVAQGLGSSGSQAIVIGCDSILEWNGQALGKPASAAVAVDRLRQMQGTSGVLHTGHMVEDLASGERVGRVRATRVDFAVMSDEEIAAYVRTGEPLNVAGSFTLDGLSSPFIAGIEGDPSNVIGLSLPLLRELLAELGIGWLEIVEYR